MLCSGGAVGSVMGPFSFWASRELCAARPSPNLYPSIDRGFREIAVRVRPPVAQERPIPAHVLYPVSRAGHDEHFLLRVRRPGDDHPERVADEGRSPELEPLPGGRRLEPDAIDRGHVAPVGDAVAALDRLPGIMLLLAVLCLLARVPADGRRVDE